MKTKEELRAKLEEIEADECLRYPAAGVAANAPLAIVQITAKGKAAALRWALGLPPGKYHGEK